jgi:glyoxylase-like metal-dependent hydrolase (beta-lactamase superfamily II)
MFDPRPVDLDLPSWRVAARLRHLDLTSPLRLARKLIAPGADVTEEPGQPVDGRDTTVLTLREFGRPPVRLRTDAVTGQLIAADLVEQHSPRGEAHVRVTFADYRDSDGLRLPFQVDITIDGLPVHSETRTRITVTTDTDNPAFTLPAGPVRDATAAQADYSVNSTEWIMNYVYAGVRFYFDLQTAPLTPAPVDLAPGVKLVLGPSHNTMVVELPDRLLAVETPMYDEYSRAALAQVKAAFPGKPLREIVGTHFHYDHIGGIRFFRTVLAGAATVTGIDDRLILPTADGGTVEIHHIAGDHADDMLMVYVSSGKILFNSDLWNPTPTMPRAGDQRGRLATQLYDAIRQRGLDVATIVGGHSGGDGTYAAPIEYLVRAAAQRSG